MARFKKMIAVLMSVAMIVCMFSVPASAATVYDKAVKLSPMELASGNFKNDGVSEYYYKISLSDSGIITFHCNGYDHIWMESYLYLVDSNGNDVVRGTYFSSQLEKEIKISKKGTYYIRITQNRSGDYYNDFYYSFKPNNDVSISLAVTMKVGEKLDLSAITSNYKGNVTWKTTKSSVATVSKGKVTAKKKGTAQIRAYMNNGDYAEITVKVTK